MDCGRSYFQRTSNNKLSIWKGSIKPKISRWTCFKEVPFRGREVHCLQTLWSHLPCPGILMLWQICKTN